MQYTPKHIPEGINTTQSHPLKELFVLLAGTAALIFSVIGIALVLSDKLVSYIPIELENKMFGESAAQAFEIKNSEEDEVLLDYLKGLVEKLQEGASEEQIPFTLHLIHSSTPNAFAFLGGHIGVTTGLLQHVQSENGLAMVLAHELGHHYNRDPIKGAGRGVILTLVFIGLLGIGGDDWVQSIIADATTVGMLSFSREQERKADEFGKQLLAAHYGHSAGADEFFESLKNQQNKKNDIPEFLSTHPNPEERIKFLKTNTPQQLTPLPELVKEYRINQNKQSNLATAESD